MTRVYHIATPNIGLEPMKAESRPPKLVGHTGSKAWKVAMCCAATSGVADSRSFGEPDFETTESTLERRRPSPHHQKLIRELRNARQQLEVVAEMRRREPARTEAALQRARLKKAKGVPIAAMLPWRRERLEQQAEGSVCLPSSCKT